MAQNCHLSKVQEIEDSIVFEYDATYGLNKLYPNKEFSQAGIKPYA
jgi:hypothetical protein